MIYPYKFLQCYFGEANNFMSANRCKFHVIEGHAKQKPFCRRGRVTDSMFPKTLGQSKRLRPKLV